jgi:hypothetical protein
MPEQPHDQRRAKRCDDRAANSTSTNQQITAEELDARSQALRLRLRPCNHGQKRIGSRRRSFAAPATRSTPAKSCAPRCVDQQEEEFRYASWPKNQRSSLWLPRFSRNFCSQIGHKKPENKAAAALRSAAILERNFCGQMGQELNEKKGAASYGPVVVLALVDEETTENVRRVPRSPRPLSGAGRLSPRAAM